MNTRFQRNPAFALGSPWGSRIDPMTRKEIQFHSGQDYKAKAGTPIPAEIAGEVVYSGFNDNLGNTVIVKHHTGGYSLYAHMQNGDRVKVGQPIWPGDIIGRVGSTGARTTGNHLHYTLIREGFEPRKASGGPIGIDLDKDNTHDPGQYGVDPPQLNETLRAQEVMSAPNRLGGARTNDSANGSFADRFESVNAWPPGWPVAEPLQGLPGLPAEHASGQARPGSPSVFKSGAAAVPLVLANPLVPDESNPSFEERFRPALPIRRLSSRLPPR